MLTVRVADRDPWKRSVLKCAMMALFVRLECVLVILDDRRGTTTTCPYGGNMHFLHIGVLEDEFIFRLGISGHRPEIVGRGLEHLRGPI